MPNRWVLPRHPVFKPGWVGSALGPGGKTASSRTRSEVNSEMNAHLFELNGYVIPA
jgi:hypothetical protein